MTAMPACSRFRNCWPIATMCLCASLSLCPCLSLSGWNGSAAHAGDFCHSDWLPPALVTPATLKDDCLPGPGSAIRLVSWQRTADRFSGESLFQWKDAPNPPAATDDEGPLISDRPDFTNAATTVGRGVLQIEAGYHHAVNQDGAVSARQNLSPETMIRFGLLADWLELRVGQDFAGEDDGFLNASGADDLDLGFKIRMTSQSGWLPEMALIPQLTLPTGHRNITDGELLPGLAWIYGWDLSDNISATGSTQFNRSVDDGTDDGYTEWAQSLTVGYSLTDRLGAFTEFFGLLPHCAETTKPEYYFDTGLTCHFTDDLQWDIRYGVGLNGAADDYFFGTGATVRFR